MQDPVAGPRPTRSPCSAAAHGQVSGAGARGDPTFTPCWPASRCPVPPLLAFPGSGNKHRAGVVLWTSGAWSVRCFGQKSRPSFDNARLSWGKRSGSPLHWQLVKVRCAEQGQPLSLARKKRSAAQRSWLVAVELV